MPPMKTYSTKEGCIAENGEHAWYKPTGGDFGGAGISCAVYHMDGFCDMNDPMEKCHHCPAVRHYRRVQAPRFEWIES